METIERIYDIRKFKAEIKVLAGYQVFLKNQRKTERLIGNREMPADDAAYEHRNNREKLSAMYVAYGTMRGKVSDNHISKKADPYTLSRIQSNIEKYLKDYKLEQKEVA